MSVNVAIASLSISDASNDIVLIPASAIIHKDQLAGLYTINDNQTASLRWVKLGRTYGDQVEILSGLSPQEKFILANEGKLYNGAPVTIKIREALTAPE